MSEEAVKYAKLVAYDDKKNVLYETEVGQRIRFEAIKTVKSQPNSCSIMVYGMDKADADSVLTYTASVELSAGMYGVAGPIFRGDVIDGLFNNCDTPYMQLDVVDGDAFFNSYVNISVGAGETLDGLIRKGVAGCSAPVSIGRISPKAMEVRLPRGCVLFGATITVLDSVAKAINGAWYVCDGQLYLLRDQDMQSGSAFDVDVETDLVGVPVVDAWSVSFSHLIDSRVVLGSAVRFSNAEAAIGTFRIVSIQIIGDTRDGEWRMNVSALRQEDGSPAMSAKTQNIWR